MRPLSRSVSVTASTSASCGLRILTQLGGRFVLDSLPDVREEAAQDLRGPAVTTTPASTRRTSRRSSSCPGSRTDRRRCEPRGRWARPSVQIERSREAATAGFDLDRAPVGRGVARGFARHRERALRLVRARTLGVVREDVESPLRDGCSVRAERIVDQLRVLDLEAHGASRSRISGSPRRTSKSSRARSRRPRRWDQNAKIGVYVVDRESRLVDAAPSTVAAT